MRLRYRSARGRFALIASILGSGMAFVDATAVNVALPAIEADLRTGSDSGSRLRRSPPPRWRHSRISTQVWPRASATR